MKKLMNKKIFLIIISTLLLLGMAATLLSIPSVHAAPTKVQGPIRGVATNSNIAVTMTSAPASGNVMIAVIGITRDGGGSSTHTVNSISETGVTWSTSQSIGVTDSTNHIDDEIWTGVVGSGASTSITITLSSLTSPTYAVADISEYSGLLTTGLLDTTATNSGSSTTATTGTTAATSQGAELWIGAITADTYAQSNPTNGFTLSDGALYSSYLSVGYLEKIVSRSGTASSGTTVSTSSPWIGCIATFKAATVKTTPTVSVPTLNPVSPISYGSSVTAAVTVSGSLHYSYWSSYFPSFNQ